jgi:hypothetical protein
MIVQGTFRYFYTVDDEGNQFRWRVVRMSAGMSAGPGTILDEGVESTVEAAQHTGSAALQNIVDSLQSRDKQR